MATELLGSLESHLSELVTDEIKLVDEGGVIKNTIDEAVTAVESLMYATFLRDKKAYQQKVSRASRALRQVAKRVYNNFLDDHYSKSFTLKYAMMYSVVADWLENSEMSKDKIHLKIITIDGMERGLHLREDGVKFVKPDKLKQTAKRILCNPYDYELIDDWYNAHPGGEFL